MTALTHRADSRAKRRKPSHSLRADSRAGTANRPRCYYCGKRLPVTTRAHYCGNSCRAQMSKLKRRLADLTCQHGFGWKPGEGEALIAKFGLPRMEGVLHMAGWTWHAEAKQWQRQTAEMQGAA